MSETRRLRIVCKGDHGKTISVTDAETGKPLSVVSAEFKVEVSGVPQLTVTTYQAECDIEADARVIRLCPGCQKEREEPRPVGQKGVTQAPPKPAPLRPFEYTKGEFYPGDR